jgi:hypothetical protein
MLIRLLVVLLLAMNAGVALWWAMRPAPVSVAPPLVEPGTTPLRLLAETETVPDHVAAAEVVGPPVPEIPIETRVCLEIGPFQTQVDLRRAINALMPVAERIQYRDTRTSIRRGFRVFIPPSDTREAALATARELTSLGLRDYYVVTAGAEQNTVSLGLYRDENNARRRFQEVTAMGFDVRLEPRDEEIAQYWVDLDVGEGFDWRSALGGGSGVGRREIPCR